MPASNKKPSALQLTDHILAITLVVVHLCLDFACMCMLDNASLGKRQLPISFLLQCLDLLEGLIPRKEEHHVLSANHLSRLFVFALMWGVGALLELDDRAKMEQFLVNHGKLPLPDIQEGSQDTIFEFVVDDTGQYKRFHYIRADLFLAGLDCIKPIQTSSL